MGIPKFFKWLTRRYPLILKNIQREEDCPPIDNLYLDLNGIVHNCIHGNDAKLHERVSNLTNFDEVWANIMKAIDEIVHSVKPTNLIFLAVDGVAPRAKMNQQRARRFRTAKDSQLLKEQLQKEGKEAPSLFDSNSISPGTKFMSELGKQLEFFTNYKLNTDPLYQNLKGGVILSDASVPGEGEHKMMDFIRQAKNQPGYDPNTRHCFYGADADLIMLSLLTHEPNFIIIREEHIVKKIKQGGVQRIDLQMTKNFQLIFISLMREYIHLEYSVLATQMKMKFDVERIIDDFVFFCFFIGNDFLPSLSALDISEGSLDSLIDLYKEQLPKMNDYITEAGKIYWDRAQPFINMLGKHEHESFKKRIHSIEQARYDKIISFDPDFGKTSTKMDKAQIIKHKLQEKINEKKKMKIVNLVSKNKAKQFKKYSLMKRFEEDEINQSLTPYQKQVRRQLLDKYKEIRQKQRAKSGHVQSEVDEIDKSKQAESLKEVVASIEEEYFSDLQLEDIGDDQVSDVDESDIDITGIPELDTNDEIGNKIKVQQQIADKYSQENLDFMNEFIRMYSADPEAAKAKYYMTKVKFDVQTASGATAKKRMLMKYLEGLQWVLYYYYRGAQHWRWYYPYHYAPMISDIDDNIVQNFLSGKVTIETFEIDVNCSQINEPYTPFQQLLSILPAKSIKLLPEQYTQIVHGDLKEYFPDDFDIDLNGRALPWEAACLIPFCEEYKFIDQETTLLNIQPILKEDAHRNIVYFHYKKFVYDENLKKDPQYRNKKLETTITSLKPLNHNYVTCQIIDEYKDVGKYSFLPKLLPGINLPCVDFPSFKWLGANSIDYDEKCINQVFFKRVLIKIPSCPEDKSNEDFESYIYNYLKNTQKEIYSGYPFQFEAFPTVFEDEKHTYTLYGDVYTNIYKIHKDVQQLDKDKFDQFAKRSFYRLLDQGLLVQNCKAFVSINKVSDVRYDSQYDQFYKVYSEQTDLIPMCLVMKKRDPRNYLDMNQRCSSLIQSINPGKQLVCLNMQLFGVVGKVNQVDSKKNLIKVEFDKEEEEQKIHDPFFGQMCLIENNKAKNDKNLKRFYTDQEIEQDLKLKGGVIGRITSSFLITFNDKEKMERQVIDLGLNIKNFTKKVHIPDYVRFVVDIDLMADNYYDDYNHNAHARGYKQPRRHWEYSQECTNYIKEYYTKYREVFETVQRVMRNNKQVHSLKDIYHKLDPDAAAKRVKEISTWIESLPISHLPYVEMGFDALHEDLIDQINSKKEHIQQNCSAIKLKCRQYEYLKPSLLYQENFPFWSQPFNEKAVNDYVVGDRVMNINSSKREYTPFGLRGTVVGKTNEKVIVLFDEQYLTGNNIYGHCDDYKGGYINPNYLINLTKKFTSVQKKNAEIVQSFMEQPVTEEQKQQIAQQVHIIQEQQQQVPHQQHHHVKAQKLDSVKQYAEPMQEESKVVQIDTSSHRQVFLVQNPPQHFEEDSKIQQQEEELKESADAQEEAEYYPEQEEDKRSEGDNEIESGFIQNEDLVNNPDFQQLMDMMNMAKLIQGPLNLNLNVNAEEFVPKTKKDEQQ